MKISEIILEAEKPKLSRREAERRFNLLRAEREASSTPPSPTQDTPQAPSTGPRTHTIRRPRAAAPVPPPPRSKAEQRQREVQRLNQISADLDKKFAEMVQLRTKYEELVPRAQALAYREHHNLPSSLTNFDWRKMINNTAVNVVQRQDDTLTALRQRVNDLEMYLKYPMRFQQIVNRSEFYLQPPQD